MVWSGTARRVLAGAVVAVAAAVLVASAASAGPRASSSAAAGKVFGGLTLQGWPVMIQFSNNIRRIARATAGLHLTCTSGGVLNVPDTYVRLSVNKRGRFSSAFGPEPVRDSNGNIIRNPDGTTSDIEGSVSGAVNRRRSKISGRWQFKITDHDAAGNVTDTCDSGSVSWTAKQ